MIVKIQNPTCICDCSLTLYVSQHVFCCCCCKSRGRFCGAKTVFSEVIACQRAVLGTRWSAGDWEDTEDGADLGGEKTWGNGQVTLGSDIFDKFGRFMSDSIEMWVVCYSKFVWDNYCCKTCEKREKTKMFPTPFHGKKIVEVIGSLVVIVRDEILPPVPKNSKEFLLPSFGNSCVMGAVPKNFDFWCCANLMHIWNHFFYGII